MNILLHSFQIRDKYPFPLHFVEQKVLFRISIKKLKIKRLALVEVGPRVWFELPQNIYFWSPGANLIK